MKITIRFDRTSLRLSLSYILCLSIGVFYLHALISEYLSYETVTGVEILKPEQFYNYYPLIVIAKRDLQNYWTKEQILAGPNLLDVIDKITFNGISVNVTPSPLNDQEENVFIWIANISTINTTTDHSTTFMNISVHRNEKSAYLKFYYQTWISDKTSITGNVKPFASRTNYFFYVFTLADVNLLESPYTDDCTTSYEYITYKSCKETRKDKFWRQRTTHCLKNIGRNKCRNLISHFLAKSISTSRCEILISLGYNLKFYSEAKVDFFSQMIIILGLITTVTDICVVDMFSKLSKLFIHLAQSIQPIVIGSFRNEMKKFIFLILFASCSLQLSTQIMTYFEYKMTSQSILGKPSTYNTNHINICFEFENILNDRSRFQIENKSYKYIDDMLLDVDNIFANETDMYFKTYFVGNKKCFFEISTNRILPLLVNAENEILKKIILNYNPHLSNRSFKISLLTKDIQRQLSLNIPTTIEYDHGQMLAQWRVKYKLLPSPYSTNCVNYLEFNYKSRAECYDTCIISKNSNNLIPYGAAWSSKYNMKYYTRLRPSDASVHSCLSECRFSDCGDEFIFLDAAVVGGDSNEFTIANRLDSIDVIYHPSETMTSLISNLCMILSFWTGLCVLDVVAIVFKNTHGKIIFEAFTILCSILIIVQSVSLSQIYFKYHVKSRLSYGPSDKVYLPKITLRFEVIENSSSISPSELSSLYQFNESIISSISVYNLESGLLEYYTDNLKMEMFSNMNSLNIETDLSILYQGQYHTLHQYSSPKKMIALIEINESYLSYHNFTKIMIGRNSFNLGYHVPSDFLKWVTEFDNYKYTSDDVEIYSLRYPYETDCIDYVTDLNKHNNFYQCVMTKTFDKLSKIPSVLNTPLSCNLSRTENDMYFEECSRKFLIKTPCYNLKSRSKYITDHAIFKHNQIGISAPFTTRRTIFVPAMYISEYMILIAGTFEFWIGITICSISLKIFLIGVVDKEDESHFQVTFSGEDNVTDRPMAARHPRLKPNTWFQEVSTTI